MKRRGRTAAFVLGLIAGIINIILGVIVLILGGLAAGAASSFSSFFSMSNFGFGTGMIWLIVSIFFVVTLLNLIGGCIVRRSRVAAGVLMLITSIPLICVGLVALAVPGSAGPLLIIYLLVQAMSFIAAIIAFIPRSANKAPLNTYQQPSYGQPPYGQPSYGQPTYGQPQYGQPPYQQPQPPYGQPQPPAYQPPYGQPQPQSARPGSHSPSEQPEVRSAEPENTVSPDE
jgi:heme exporter protein D